MRHSVTATGLAGLTGLLLAGTAAHAQTAPLPLPSERRLPEYEPVGGRLGSFFLYPSVETRLEYDDNILALPNDGAGDFELTVRGAARLVSDWQRHSVEIDGYVQQNFHRRFTTEDVMEGGGRVRARIDASRNTSARIVASLDALAEDRANITSQAAARNPTRFRRADAMVTVAHEMGRLQLVGDGMIQVLDFDDAIRADGSVLDQDFRDSVLMRASLTALLEFSPRVSGLLRGQVDRLQFTGEPEEPDPFDRDTSGFAIEAGARVELTNLLFGELRAGVLRREVDDPSAPGLTGVSFGANLTWAITPLTTLRFFADRQVEEGGSQLVSGNVRSQASVDVEHELLRNVVLDARAGFARIETIGQLQTDAEEYDLHVGATWKLDRNIRIFGRADRIQRFADNTFFRQFTRNRVSAGVRMVF